MNALNNIYVIYNARIIIKNTVKKKSRLLPIVCKKIIEKQNSSPYRSDCESVTENY